MAKSKCQFTRKDLQRATYSPSWQRGVGYFQDARVESLMADGGVFCKHCAAVGLAYLAGQAECEDWRNALG